MKDTVRIRLNEYDELREYRFKQLFCQAPVVPDIAENEGLKHQIEEKDDEINRLNIEISPKRGTIDSLRRIVDVKREEHKKEIEKLKEGIAWRDDDIKDLEDEIGKKNEEIECLKGEVECQRETIKRMSQQLTEKELYEKKSKETAPTGVPAIDATVDRLLKLEAKFEAQENPYFF